MDTVEMEQRIVEKRANMEEALAATGFGKFNYILITISGFILLNVVLELLAISYVLPILAKCDLMLTVLQSGFLGGVGVLGITLTSHLWGYLADTIGRRKIIAPTLLLAFGFTLISSFSTNFWCLLIARFCNGCLVSASSATIYAFLGEFHSEGHRSKAVMWAVFIRTFMGILI
uniref:Major facilitator superfamily (MFS) profile domain-containing protein n=1 Tax=Megaselia scalaris TaxID=36166 RepID=T1GZI3_MEGSC